MAAIGHHRSNLAAFGAVQPPKTGEVRDVDFHFLDGEVRKISPLDAGRLRRCVRRVGQHRGHGGRNARRGSEEFPAGFSLIGHRLFSFLFAYSGSANESTFDPEQIATY
jgi:hypothetical protein